MSESSATVSGDAGGAPQVAETPASERDVMNAAWDAMESSEGDSAPRGIGDNGGPELEPEAPAPILDRARGPDGKFLGTAPAAPPAPLDPNAPPPAAATAVDKTAPPAWLAAHPTVDWKRLPQAVRDAMHAVPQTPSAPAAPHPFAAVVQPYEGEFRQRGLTAETGVRALLDTWAALERDPSDALPKLARQYGFEVHRIGQQPTQQAQQPDGSPHQAPAAVDPHVAALTAELQQIKGHLTHQQQQAQQAQISSLAAEIDRFAKDPAKPRPHFDAVAGHMAALLSGDAATDLADAYDKACWANPTVRAALITEQRAAEAAQRTTEAAQRAADAKRAVAVNVRTTTGAAPAAPSTDREVMSAAWDALQAREG